MKNSGRNGRDAGAQPVHVVENTERSGDADHPNDRQAAVQDDSCIPGNKLGKKLRANSRSQQQQRRDRHTDEQLHLMMQQSAVVEKSHDC